MNMAIRSKWRFLCVFGLIRALSAKVEHLELKERQLRAVVDDLRRSGRNMGFLRKRRFNHFSRFGIGGLLSISAIIISVLLQRSPIISYYVNFLAISWLPFPAIMGDFPERYFSVAVNAGNGDRKLKSESRISGIQMLIEDHLSIENRMSIIEKRNSEIRKIKTGKSKTGRSESHPPTVPTLV